MGRLRGTVLVVDDDDAVGMVLKGLLTQEGLTCSHVSDGQAALEALEGRHADLVITDLRMPGLSGIELLTTLQRRWPDLPVIVLTAHGTVPDAVEAMKRGAADFVQKPFDRAELLYTVGKALSRTASPAPPPPERSETPEDEELLGSSALIEEARRLLRKAAPGMATVLIRGESGTGKELAAKALHVHGARASGPFVKVHCGALPETLLESELFGYEKGAFTGAAQRKPGRVELASGGTLFLDEIGDVPLTIQVKLLRILQEREFERLGGTETLKADVRFVAATHRNLEAMVAEGRFREDLFYRLNVVPIRLPSLGERAGDVRLLAEHFCGLTGEKNGKPDAHLTADALALLEGRAWPGNVRQLQNFVERLVVLSDASRIDADDVRRELDREEGPLLRSSSGASSNDETPGDASAFGGAAGGASGGGAETLERRRKDVEREALIDALEKAKNNRTLAARLLGVSRRTLYNKLEEHHLI